MLWQWDAVAFADQPTVYNEGINGATHSTHDGSIKTEQYYLDNGVYNEENDTYVFADKNVQLNVKNNIGRLYN